MLTHLCSLGALEEQRQAETAAFRAKEAERAAAQAKAREDNAARVLAETQQRKAASAPVVHAAHGVKQTAATTANPTAKAAFSQPGVWCLVVWSVWWRERC